MIYRAAVLYAHVIVLIRVQATTAHLLAAPGQTVVGGGEGNWVGSRSIDPLNMGVPFARSADNVMRISAAGDSAHVPLYARLPSQNMESVVAWPKSPTSQSTRPSDSPSQQGMPFPVQPPQIASSQAASSYTPAKGLPMLLKFLSSGVCVCM